jgi:hypothetical protein
MAVEAIQVLDGNSHTNDYPAGVLPRGGKLCGTGAGTGEIRRMAFGREAFEKTV